MPQLNSPLNRCPQGYQSLFDLLREPEPPLDGRTLRDDGIKQAIEHAEKMHPGWKGEALEFVKKYLGYNTGQFMAEDVRAAALNAGVPEPPHKRAWGGVMQEAKRLKWIEATGHGYVTNPRAHCATVAIWKRTTTFNQP